MFNESQHLIATCSVKYRQNPTHCGTYTTFNDPSYCAVAEVTWATVRQAQRQCWRHTGSTLKEQKSKAAIYRYVTQCCDCGQMCSYKEDFSLRLKCLDDNCIKLSVASQYI